MSQPCDFVTISLPGDVWKDISQPSPELIDRMHILLERNTEGRLTPAETVELQSLMCIAEISLIISLALQTKNVP